MGLTQHGIGWRMVTIVSLVASIWLLGLAVRDLPIGTAYAVWTGIGAVGTAVLGMALLGEPAHPVRPILAWRSSSPALPG